MFKPLRCLFQTLKHKIHTDHIPKIGILGVPFEKGGIPNGVEDGPRELRSRGLIQELKAIREDVDIKDYGDVTYTPDAIAELPNVKQYSHFVSCTKETSKQVESIIRDGRVCLTLGGDHSISAGSVDGHVKAKDGNVCILWVDAHADINTNKTSDSGNVHGMQASILLKELADYWPYMPGMDWQKPQISVRNFAYIGLRSVDSYERLIIDKLGITNFGMEDVETFGISNVVKMALDRIDPTGKMSIHLSFDLDSLDALEAPSTTIAIRGGLTLREGVHIMESVHKTGRLGAMDVVEFTARIGNEADVKRTAEATFHMIRAALGYRRSGMRPLNDDNVPLQTFPPTGPVI